ncbi:non-histone protein [Coemansia sp. RSA 2399]|nr:non-histone protein [Coemansia sp. RSA 2399]KAJ1898793.1 non-histone protein [Coemansia sp. IMI 209127]
MPTSAATTTSTASGRGRRKNQPNPLNIHQSTSTGSTPRQQSINGIHTDHSAAPAPTATPARKPRAEKDPHAPKRPANAFVMFCQSERPSIKSSGVDMSSGELTRAMSAKWKDLPKAEKQKFYDIYEREMVRYQRELLTYKERGTAPPTPASDSTATKTLRAEQQQHKSAATADGDSTTVLSADPPQQPSSASSTSSAFAVSEAAGASATTAYADDIVTKRSSVMDIGVISDGFASAPQRGDTTRSPLYTAEPEAIAGTNGGISSAPLLPEHHDVEEQTNGNSTTYSLPERSDTNTYTTESIEDGMRTTALHEA